MRKKIGPAPHHQPTQPLQAPVTPVDRWVIHKLLVSCGALWGFVGHATGCGPMEHFGAFWSILLGCLRV